MASLVNLFSIGFNNPEFLFLFLLIPVLIAIQLLSMFYNKKKKINFPNFEALRRIGITEIYSKNTFYLYLFLIIISLLILGISGAKVQFNADSADYSYVIAIDNSDSMGANDLNPNRLEVSRIAAKKFVGELPIGTRVGLLTFSGDIVKILPLETSKLIISNAIDKINFGEIKGTNIRDAVIEAQDILEKEQLKSLILISDGQINIGNIEEIIKYSQERELLIHTIAIGTPAGGDTGYGFISKTDTDTLKALSFNTGGKFFSVSSQDEMDFSFDTILQSTWKSIEIEIESYLFITALLLITLFWVLYNFRFKNFP